MRETQFLWQCITTLWQPPLPCFRLALFIFIFWKLKFDFQMAGSTETLTVCEPGRLEEDVMMGKMVIGVNAYREVCTLHLAGQVKLHLWVGVGNGTFSQHLLSIHLIWNSYQINCLPIQVLVDKGLVTRLSTIAAEKAKKTVTKIKAALAEEVMIFWERTGWGVFQMKVIGLD